MKDAAAPLAERKRTRKASASPKRKTTDAHDSERSHDREGVVSRKSATSRGKKPGAAPKEAAAPKRKRTAPVADAGVEEALRAWRLLEARRLGVPAFRIFSDQALRAIAQARPATAAELLAVPGIGLSAVEKYGRQIYRILGEGRT
jgi:superfamily II DNA helicase RecQ